MFAFRLYNEGVIPMETHIAYQVIKFQFHHLEDNGNLLCIRPNMPWH
jgi:hypothetical protein